MTSIEWVKNTDGTLGKSLCISSNARLSSMSQIVALFTERNTVADLESEFRMISKTFNVVSVQIPAPTIATFLTGITISLKNCFAPVSVLCALSYAPVLWCDTALPEFNLRPSIGICAGLGSKIGKLFWCKWLPFAVLIALLRPAHFLFCFWRMSFALKCGWPSLHSVGFSFFGLTHFLSVFWRLCIRAVYNLGDSRLLLFWRSGRSGWSGWDLSSWLGASALSACRIFAVPSRFVVCKVTYRTPLFAFDAPLFACIDPCHVLIQSQSQSNCGDLEYPFITAHNPPLTLFVTHSIIA
jgi:hypothetical protein